MNAAHIMIGLGLALGSQDARVTDTPDTAPIHGIRRSMFTQDGFLAFWEPVLDEIRSGTLRYLLLHRLFGQPSAFARFGFDARTALSRHPLGPQYIRWTLKIIDSIFAINPAFKLDIYLSDMAHPTMAIFNNHRQGHIWRDIFALETELPFELIHRGLDVRMVFDHSATYPERESAVVRQLSRYYPGRVVAESIPPLGHPLSGLPAAARQSRYEVIADRDPDWIDACPHITRFASKQGDDLLGMVTQAQARGEDCVLFQHRLIAENTSIAELVERANDAGDPQGTD